jgi:hypothetical protein
MNAPTVSSASATLPFQYCWLQVSGASSAARSTGSASIHARSGRVRAAFADGMYGRTTVDRALPSTMIRSVGGSSVVLVSCSGLVRGAGTTGSLRGAGTTGSRVDAGQPTSSLRLMLGPPVDDDRGPLIDGPLAGPGSLGSACTMMIPPCHERGPSTVIVAEC